MRRTSWRHVLIALALVIPLGCTNDPTALPSLRVSGNPPSNLTATTTATAYSDISLAWQDNSINENGWEVHRSTTGPTGAFTLLSSYPSPNVTSASDGGLRGSTQYCYKVRSYKQQGRQADYSAFSNVACETTFPVPVPAAPSGVHAVPDQWGRIQISWIDNAVDETGFRVERSPAGTDGWNNLGTTEQNVVSVYDWQPPASEATACYRVFAFNSFGDSPSSNIACSAMPNAPSNLSATSTGSDVNLTWTDNSGVEDGYQILRWTATTSATVVGTVAVNVTTYPDAGLADDSYYYQVRATKDGGTSPSSNNYKVVVATAPPAAPSALDATPNGSTSTWVIWTDNSATETGFRMQRSADHGLTWSDVGTTDADQSGFADNGAPGEQELCYQVLAVNSVGISPPSNMDCTTLPAAPTDLKPTPGDPGTIKLTWTDHPGVADGYQVLRLVNDCSYYQYCYPYWAVIAVLGRGATEYTDTGLNSGQIYDYAVVATTNDGGQSDWATVETTAP